MIDKLISMTVAIISQCTHVSIQQVVCLKYTWFYLSKKKIYPAAVSNMEVIGEFGKNRLKGVAGLQLTEITWRVSET